jgi:hypothetical protein
MCYQSITEGRGLELSFESGRGAWRRESKAAESVIQSGNDGGTTRVRKVRFFFFSSLFLLLSAMRSMCYLWQRRNRDSKDILSMAHAHVCKTRVPHPGHDPVCPRERLGARDDQHGTTGTCTYLLRHQYCLRHLAHAISTTGRHRRGQSAGCWPLRRVDVAGACTQTVHLEFAHCFDSQWICRWCRQRSKTSADSYRVRTGLSPHMTQSARRNGGV